MAGYRLTEPAREDLHSLAVFIARDSASAAERVVDDLEAAVRGLAEMPGKGHSRADLTDDPDLLFWPVHNFLSVYRAKTTPLEVVRIVHARRDVWSELK